MMNVASILLLSATLAHAGGIKSRDHTTERRTAEYAAVNDRDERTEWARAALVDSGADGVFLAGDGRRRVEHRHDAAPEGNFGNAVAEAHCS